MIDPTFRIDEGLNAPVTDRQARKTAVVVASVILGLAAWFLYRGRLKAAGIFSGLGFALVFAGFLFPLFGRRFHVYWMKLASALGYINSRILLSLLFYLVFAPYGFVSRLVGRDPLRRRGPKLESYWTTRNKTRQSREQFERLF